MKLSVSCLSPLGSIISVVFPSVIFGVKVNDVSPVVGVAQVNCTDVPTLTFIDLGVSDSMMSASLSIKKRRKDSVLFCIYDRSHLENNKGVTVYGVGLATFEKNFHVSA